MRCYKCMEEISDAPVCPHCGYVQNQTAENKQYLAPGTVLGGVYTVGIVLGSGGFGVTYIGWDENLRRKVAIKEYFPSSLSTRIPGQTFITAFTGEKQQIFNHGKERFVEEARLLMRFTGEDGIVSVYDVLEENGTVYMVMEYIEGITLKQSIEKFGKIPERQLLDCMIPMLLSLKFVHNAGFTHRDISPDNIMCLPDGSVKLLDFGAARYSVMEESKSLSVIVKQGYTPIEQYQSHGKQGPWTDLYAAAATMYTALTGIVPEESLERMGNDTLKKPSQLGVKVSENTENAILAALNLRPEDRPQDVDAFLEILTGQKQGGLVVHKKSKKPLIAILAAVTVLLIGAGITTAALLKPGAETVEESGTGIVVPNAINHPEAEAEVLFYENSLHMAVTGGRLYDAEMIKAGYIEENLVVEQDPGAGTSADPESTVGVILSKGKEKAFVPSVTDQMRESALETIAKNGFGDSFTIELQEEYSDTNMAGTVLSQNIDADTAVDFDGKIVLTISSGRKTPLTGAKTTTIEDYTGRDFDEVKRALLEDNIYLVKSAAIYSADQPYGAILSQSPAKGSDMQGGGAVYVVTSLGIEMARVPDVRYMTTAEAKQTLMESGLSWTIRYVIRPEVAVDHVAEQGIAPYTKTPFGTEIELTVSADSEGTEQPEALDLTMDPTRASLSVGETEQFTCSYAGDTIWAISNPYIAKVDDSGLVTAAGFGAATVSAAAEGNIVTAIVTVMDESVFTKLDAYELKEGETVSLSSEIPEEIRADVVWRSSSPAVATVDENGTVTARTEGCTSITASYRDRIAECSITVVRKAEYVKIAKKLLLGDVSTAKQTLENYKIEYATEEEYSSTIAKGKVVKMHYVGHSDNDSFYISIGSKVVLQCSRGANVVESIAVQTPPSKTVYTAGEVPNLTGLVLTAKYTDGSTKEVRSGYSASTAPLTTVGAQKLTIYYEKKSTTVSLTVNPVEVQSLSVTPATLSLLVGDTKTLSVTCTPANATDKTVSVASSDPAVVATNGLTLTAKKAGSAIVTVTARNGKSAKCTVTVTAPEPKEKAVTSVSVQPTELTLRVEQTAKLTAAVQPTDATDKKITWRTSDPDIVTVEISGVIKGCKAGSATITAVANNGKQAVCKVTVTGDKALSVKSLPAKTVYYIDDAFAVNGLKLSYTDENGVTKEITTGYQLNCDTSKEGTQSVAVSYGGLTTSFQITVKTPSVKVRKITAGDRVILVADTDPANADVEWTSSNREIFYFSEGQLVPVSSGTAYACATMVYNDTEYYDMCALTVEAENYSFSLWSEQYDDGYQIGVHTDIPEFDAKKVTWEVVPDAKYGIDDYGNLNIYPYSESVTVTAYYTCGGRQYKDSCTVQPVQREYVFSLYRDGKSDDGDVGYYAVKTDIPGFDISSASWSVSGALSSGWIADGYYVVDEALDLGESYTVFVSYEYGGRTYSDSYTFTMS